MSNKTAYPLAWPDGWPRTKNGFRVASNFRKSSVRSWTASDGVTRESRSFDGRHSMSDARDFLALEIERLGGSKAVLSTNVELRLDGLPYSNRATPQDPGAAVYFELKSKPVALACDKWARVEDNVWALAKHIEALRGQQRWGFGRIEQAFRGYMAIPERASGDRWQDVLGVAVNATKEQVIDAWRSKVKAIHSNGDDHELAAKVNLAYEEAKKCFTA
jgi:hypothetical protein